MFSGQVVSNSSVTPCTVAHQAPLSIGFPRQNYWSESPFFSPRNLPDPGIEPVSPAAPALAGGFLATEPPGKPCVERHMFAKMAHRRSSLPVEEIVKLGYNEHLKNHQAYKGTKP